MPLPPHKKVMVHPSRNKNNMTGYADKDNHVPTTAWQMLHYTLPREQTPIIHHITHDKAQPIFLGLIIIWISFTFYTIFAKHLKFNSYFCNPNPSLKPFHSFLLWCSHTLAHRTKRAENWLGLVIFSQFVVIPPDTAWRPLTNLFKPTRQGNVDRDTLICDSGITHYMLSVCTQK